MNVDLPNWIEHTVSVFVPYQEMLTRLPEHPWPAEVWLELGTDVIPPDYRLVHAARYLGDDLDAHGTVTIRVDNQVELPGAEPVLFIGYEDSCGRPEHRVLWLDGVYRPLDNQQLQYRIQPGGSVQLPLSLQFCNCMLASPRLPPGPRRRRAT